MSVIASLRLKYLVRRLKADPAKTIPRLGRLGDKRAVPVLLPLLNNPKFYSTDIVTALGVLGDSRAVEPLLDKMGRVYTGEERKLIAETLGLLGHTEWTDMVRGDNGDWDRIADSGTSGNNLAFLPLGASLSILAYCSLKLNAIGRLGDKRLIEPVLEVLCGNWIDGNMRKRAAATLSTLGEPKWVGVRIVVDG